MPTVSVILPSFNRLRFLKLAIESVYSQTYADWELIIADDGSSEETRAYLRSIASPPVRTLWLPHCGNPAQVRNAAIEVSAGRYLAFLDSDDIWAPSKLEVQVRALYEHARCRWSYTACERIDENGNPLSNQKLAAMAPRDGWILEPLLRLETAIAMPAVVAERDLINAIGRFDERQRYGEFHDLCLRLAMKSEVVAIAQPLCSVRAHDEHYSGDRVAAHTSWMQLYAKMAELVPDSQLRSLCLRMRAEQSWTLVRMGRKASGYRGLLTTLPRALMLSWRQPRLWYDALRNTVSVVVPDAFRSASPGPEQVHGKERQRLQ
jgi:glycosyltransferase involved in cell wall biosynthesis